MSLRYIKYFLVNGLLCLLPALSWAQGQQTSLGLNYLTQTQNADGSWGGTATSITEVFPSTSTAVDALKLIETTPSNNRTNAIGYLSAQALDVTDYLSRRIVSLAGTGADTSTDLSALIAFKNADNGWGGAAGFTSEVLDAALALRALSAGGGNASTMSGAVSYLLAAQNPEGGWGFVAGQTSHVYYTALVMQALETQAQTTANANTLSRAATYLLGQQQSDGSWSNIPDTALAFLAIARTTGNVTVKTKALEYLLARQLPNGSWNDDPYSTALALQALKASEFLDRDIDNDGDGYTENQGDCNDADASVYPGAPDLSVDGVDQDCNGIDGPPIGEEDSDGDDISVAQGDCNDTDPAIHPGATDTPDNGIDENCDGQDGVFAVEITGLELFKLVGLDEIPSAVFGPYETVSIHVTVNDPTAPLEVFVTDSAGRVFLTTSAAGVYYFDTANAMPGAYTVIVRAGEAGTGIILDEANALFMLQSGAGILSGVLSVLPRSTRIGATETVELTLGLGNGSNTTVGFTVQHEITTPAGGPVNSGSTTQTLLPDKTFASIPLAAFTYTFTEAGEYPITVRVYQGTELLTTVTGSIPAAPAIRIDPSLTVTPESVLPDGDKRIRIEIRLEGVEDAP